MGRCCVPNCRGNYDGGPKVRVFSFPKDDRRIKWKQAIRRDDLDIDTLRDPKVCELHFKPEYLRSTTSYTDADGKTIEVAMNLTRLTPDAVPTILPNCASYLSNSAPIREEPDAKRRRREATRLQDAIEMSLATHEEEEHRNKVSSYGQLLSLLEGLHVSDFWVMRKTDAAVAFFHVNENSAPPEIERSVVVNNSLKVSAFWRKVELRGGEMTVPDRLEDMRSLESVLKSVQQFKAPDRCEKDEKLKACFQLLFSLLDDLSSDDLLPVEKMETLRFLKEQLHLLNRERTAFRYSSELVILSSIFFTISPHAYKFVRSSGKLILPHPCTITRLCNKYNVSPAAEQSDQGFLSYITKKANLLKPHERTVTLMMDEIYIQQYFEYKGGSLTGTASNSSEAAKTAHVFMTQSLLSGHKDVAHILPVFSIEASDLHEVLKKVILGLEKAGLKVIAVVSDNNSINRKVMSLFSKKKAIDIVYPHSADNARPLFFAVDPVHLLKCIRNNWLNQKSPDTSFLYPEFKSTESKLDIKKASFQTLRDLYTSERHNLSKFAYGLTYKALHPTNIERQNVKLALKVINPFVAQALKTPGTKPGFPYAADTAEFIDLIHRWWCIVNTKTPSKGRHLRDPYQEPVRNMTGVQLQFLGEFVDWLDTWNDLKMSGSRSGSLTPETHAALRLTSYALIELSRYCLEELNFEYVLLGKFQTDSLESRFGRYRRLAGSNYHISVQQIFESETKLRLQGSLVFPDMKELSESSTITFEGRKLQDQYNITVTWDDINSKKQSLPAIIYIAGFCAHAALNKLPCEACARNLTREDRDIPPDENCLIQGLTRGALKFPQPVVVNAVLHTEIVLEKLTTKENAAQFHSTRHQREQLLCLLKHLLSDDEELDVCCNGHHPDKVISNILWAATNTYMKNYVQMKTDLLTAKKAAAQERKLKKFRCLDV
ncbi:uncharacterized protein LOC144100615 [Amblyomma americanum]